ncbi:MAG: hypothetical protein KUG82_21945 [Pseudomonadales bacterium]|nr:hypothetical protein [Pseudomonadales bacterium]
MKTTSNPYPTRKYNDIKPVRDPASKTQSPDTQQVNSKTSHSNTQDLRQRERSENFKALLKSPRPTKTESPDHTKLNPSTAGLKEQEKISLEPNKPESNEETPSELPVPADKNVTFFGIPFQHIILKQTATPTSTIPESTTPESTTRGTNTSPNQRTVDLIAKHVNTAYIEDYNFSGKKDKADQIQLSIKLNNAFLPNTNLMITQQSSGNWMIKSSSTQYHTMNTIKRYAPKLMSAFSDSGKGDLEFEATILEDGKPNCHWHSC